MTHKNTLLLAYDKYHTNYIKRNVILTHLYERYPNDLHHFNLFEINFPLPIPMAFAERIFAIVRVKAFRLEM